MSNPNSESLRIEWVCHDCGAEGTVEVYSEDYWKCMLDTNAAHNAMSPHCNGYWAAIFPKDHEYKRQVQ